MNATFIRRITLGRAAVTTRKRPVLGAVLLLAGLSGCSTAGALHLYSIGPANAEVHDIAVNGDDAAASVPSHAGQDVITGFGYDSFTDHFFLRLAPGNRLRVVDRPARKIKREFVVGSLPADGGGDLAVSPRDGHLYWLMASGEIQETSRLAEPVRHFRPDLPSAPVALAYDIEAKELLALAPDRVTVDRLGLDGGKRRSVRLDQPVRASLAYDSETRRLFAPLASRAGVGVFDDTGRTLRTLPLPAGDRFIDVGPHAFLRVF